MLLVALLTMGLFAVHGFINIGKHGIRLGPLRMKSEPLVYKSVRLSLPDRKEMTVFYKANDERVDQIMTTMKTDEYVDMSIIKHFTEKGLAFVSERRKNQPLFKPANYRVSTERDIVQIPVLSNHLTDNLYVNVGSSGAPMYVKYYEADVMKTNLVDGTMTRDYMTEQEYGHKDAFELTLAEEIRRIKAMLIPRLHRDFLANAPEWRRYLQIGEARKDMTISDIAAIYSANYSYSATRHHNFDTSPGYMGTIPIRTDLDHLKDNNRPKDNETVIPLPWPLVREVPFHVRQPAAHPASLDPILWVGFMDKYPESYQNRLLQLPYRYVWAGPKYMGAADSMRIANNPYFGDCYDPAVQLPHFGMKHPRRKRIPFCKTAHGPTVPSWVTCHAPDWMKHLAKKVGHPWTWSPDPPDPFEVSVKQMEEMSEEADAIARGFKELGLDPADLDATKRAIVREVKALLDQERAASTSNNDTTAPTEDDMERRRVILSNKLTREKELLRELESEYRKESDVPFHDHKDMRGKWYHQDVPPVTYAYNIANYGSTRPQTSFRPGEGSWMQSTTVPTYVHHKKKRRKKMKKWEVPAGTIVEVDRNPSGYDGGRSLNRQD